MSSALQGRPTDAEHWGMERLDYLLLTLAASSAALIITMTLALCEGLAFTGWSA